MSKITLKKRRIAIAKQLRKSGIHSLQEVLNTSVISEAAKIKYIRHTYTCYNTYLSMFYKDEAGKLLRKELNDFILDVVNGKRTVEELASFNKQLKSKLKAAKDNCIQERKRLFIENTTAKMANTNTNAASKCTTKKSKKPIKYVPPPDIPELSEREKTIVAGFSPRLFTNRMTEEEKIAICKTSLIKLKEHWRKHYIEAKSPIKKFIVELYLLKRDPNLYPTDFSDLDYLPWKDVVKLAKRWLLEVLDNNPFTYTRFIKEQLPLWIKNNAEIHKDEILERLNV